MSKAASFVFGFLFALLGAVVGGQVTKFPAAAGGASYDQDLNTTDSPTFATLNTGQGVNELYDMNQNVETDSEVTFGVANIGQSLPFATDGDIRWSSVGSLRARNAANDADIHVLGFEDDHVRVGSHNQFTASADGNVSVVAREGGGLTLGGDNGVRGFFISTTDVEYYGGYLRDSTVLAVAPAAGDCDHADETNRFVYDSTNDFIYLCSGASGWRKIATTVP